MWRDPDPVPCCGRACRMCRAPSRGMRCLSNQAAIWSPCGRSPGKPRVADDVDPVLSDAAYSELSTPVATVNGAPVCSVTIPFVCQPPRTTPNGHLTLNGTDHS